MSIPIGQLYAFLFLFTRASGIFIFTPFLGNFLVPVAVRILLSLTIGYLLSLASALPQIPAEMSLASLTLGLAGELAVGMVIGFAAHCVFAGLQYAGQLLGFQVGLSFVNTVDPQTSNRSTTLSIYMNFLGMMLFLGFNGHHWFIEAIGKSLTILPPYSIRFTGSFIAHMTVLVGKIFVIGFQIAAPLLAAAAIDRRGPGHHWPERATSAYHDYRPSSEGAGWDDRHGFDALLSAHSDAGTFGTDISRDAGFSSVDEGVRT